MTPDPGGPAPDGHPSTEDLGHLASEGTADPHVAEHAAGCARCQQSLADLRAVRALLAGLAPPELPVAVADRLERALAAETGRRPDSEAALHQGAAKSLRRRPPAWLAAAAAATAILLGGGAALRLTDGFGNRGGEGPASTSGLAAGSAAESAATAADAARVVARVRTLLPARTMSQPSAVPAPSAAPPASSPAGTTQKPVPAAARADPAVSRCLTALGVAPGRLILVTPVTFAGQPATVLVLSPATGGANVDVRVVRPGCPNGRGDLRYRLDRLAVP